jgi:hypothetical protein
MIVEGHLTRRTIGANGYERESSGSQSSFLPTAGAAHRRRVQQASSTSQIQVLQLWACEMPKKPPNTAATSVTARFIAPSTRRGSSPAHRL